MSVSHERRSRGRLRSAAVSILSLFVLSFFGGCITIYGAPGAPSESNSQERVAEADEGGVADHAEPAASERPADGGSSDLEPPDSGQVDRGPKCSSDDDCAGDEVCRDGACVSEDPCKGVTCPTGECCYQGKCGDCFRSYCKPCSTNDDCEPGGICVSATSSRFCTARCGKGDKCPDDASCVDLGADFGKQCVPIKGEC